jgi:histidinol phosphatase-like enzyme
MEEEIEKREGRIERIYYCPHHPEAKCFCRKPNPGLLIKAIEELNIETASSWLIGDSPRDIVAGKRIGIRTILVLSGKTTQWPPSDFSSFMLDKEEKKAEIKLPDYISSNLYFAVKLILNIDSYFKIEA